MARHPRAVARGSARYGDTAPPPAPPTGLAFLLANSAAGSDIALQWTGANMLSRTSHTAIWKIKYRQQTGYYAVAWHSHLGAWDSGAWAFGTHPWPGNSGAVNGSGEATDGSGGSGTVHYHEVAGVGAPVDTLCTAGGGGGTLVTKGVELWQARVVENVAGTCQHRFYPDVQNNPSFVISRNQSAASIASATPGSPAFYIGGSYWTGNGNTNDETPSCDYIRHLIQRGVPSTIAEIQALFARTTDLTTSIDANCWYSCLNPTPSNIADRSGAGHDPAWRNSNRPTLWTP